MVWGDSTGAPGTTNVCVLQDCREYTRNAAYWRYYSVIGVKIEWHPVTFSGAATTIGRGVVASDSASSNTLTAVQFPDMVDYDTFAGQRYFKKYVGVAKHMKRTNALQSTEWTTNFSNGSTQFMVATTAAAGVVNGTFEVTYYMKLWG